jgi:thymidylate synthase
VRPNELGKPTYLDCCLYQRSGDMPLGVPFNIASYALLTHMIAHVTDLISGTLVQFIGDAHIYENQIQLCHTQTSRKPYEFPQFEFTTNRKNIDDFCLADFIIKNYKHHPRIIYPFSV